MLAQLRWIWPRSQLALRRGSCYNVHGFYGLSNYFYRNEKKYKTVLQQCRAEQPFDLNPFITFGVEGFSSELKGINNFIKAKLNRVVYRAMLVRAFNTRVGTRRKQLNQREYNLLDFLLSETEPVDPFSENPSRIIKLPELMKNKAVRWQYRDVTQRTLYRELIRLSNLGFIRFNQDEATKIWTVELDFEAIGKYEMKEGWRLYLSRPRPSLKGQMTPRPEFCVP